MTTHASANKQWTEAALNDLTVEKGFRLRGLEVTRLDTFIDAAFAFVLTLLVISFDEIPSSYGEMLAAMKRIPAFAASFAVLMMFWLQHRRWSRRYGLEDFKTILLSLALIFVVLVYVYPLRTIFEGMFSSLTGGFLASSFSIESYAELRGIFVFYSSGFLAMSLLLIELYRSALRSGKTLALNNFEEQETREDMQGWGISSVFGPVSIILALTLPDEWVTLAGYIYFGMFPAARLPAFLSRRRLAREQYGSSGEI